jgi:hypothetical protein
MVRDGTRKRDGWFSSESAIEFKRDDGFGEESQEKDQDGF